LRADAGDSQILLEDLKCISRRTVIILVHITADIFTLSAGSGADPQIFLEATEGILGRDIPVPIDIATAATANAPNATIGCSSI
jgi:hypothetical protein